MCACVCDTTSKHAVTHNNAETVPYSDEEMRKTKERVIMLILTVLSAISISESITQLSPANDDRVSKRGGEKGANEMDGYAGSSKEADASMCYCRGTRMKSTTLRKLRRTIARLKKRRGTVPLLLSALAG